MSATAFVVNLFVVSVLVAVLHWWYGSWKRHQLSVSVITIIAWTLPFLIICSLPIDVSVTFYNQCLLDGNLSDNTTPATLSTTSLTTTTISTTTFHQSPIPSILLFDQSSLNNNNLLQFTNHTTTTTNTTTPLNPPSHTPKITTPSQPPTRKTTSPILTPPTTSTPPQPSIICVRPWTYIPPSSLSIFWHIVYWTSQCLTWIWLPMMQSYAKAGEFTFLGKLRYALVINGIYYGTYIVIFTCLLVYLAASSRLTFNLGQLKVLAITASNTWGLTLLVLLLGYGLVELPRSCWHAANTQLRVKRLCFKMAKITMEKIEAEEELEDVLAEVSRVNNSMSPTNPLRKFLEVILKLTNTDTQTNMDTQTNTQTSTRVNFDRTEESDVDLKTLVKLHRRLIFAKQSQSSKGCLWRGVVAEAIRCQDTLENMRSAFKMFHRSPAAGSYNGVFSLCYHSTVEWYWRCRVSPWLLKSVAIVTGMFSLMVVWSECLFFVRSPVLSLFAHFVHLAQLASGYHAIEFVSIATIAYLSACTYFSIFSLKIFSYYSLIGPHHTDQNSMVFCGMLLCRLTPPLCLNFLGLIHLDSHVTNNNHMVDTSYTRFMGNLVVLPFIASGFNIYFPIAIVVLCSLTLFGIGARLLHCFGFQQFIGDDEMTQEMVDEGVELIKRERRKLTRGMDGGIDGRRRQINERTNDKVVPHPSIIRRIGSDRSELLNDAEPMGYRSYEESEVVISRDNTPSLTPTSARLPLSLHNNNNTINNNNNNISELLEDSSNTNNNRPSFATNTFIRPNAGPPRNLFDDV